MANGSRFLGQALKASCVLLLGAQCILSNANAAPVETWTLTDGNSKAYVDVGSQMGMYGWFVDGKNQLNQQWFWYRVGDTPQQAISGLLPRVVTQPSANVLSATYYAGTFNIRIDYMLTGGAAGDGISDIVESIIINNTAASPLDLHFYQYSDFDLGENPLGDVVTIRKTGSIYDLARQTKGGFGVSETIDSPGANWAEAAFAGQTLASLNSGVPINLNNNTSAGPGDVTWALQWDFLIPAGQSQFVFKDKRLDVALIPEPGVLALLSVGLLGFVLRRKH